MDDIDNQTVRISELLPKNRISIDEKDDLGHLVWPRDTFVWKQRMDNTDEPAASPVSRFSRQLPLLAIALTAYLF